RSSSLSKRRGTKTIHRPPLLTQNGKDSMTALLLALALPALLVFVARYARYSPWQKTYQGRTLMAQKIAWIVMIAHCLPKEFWHYPGFDIGEHTILSVVVVLFYVTLWGLLKAQHASRPVSKEQGQGYVEAKDVERTAPRGR